MDDGNATLAFDRMEPIGATTPPPRSIEPGDVLFVVDPMTLQVVDLRFL